MCVDKLTVQLSLWHGRSRALCAPIEAVSGFIRYQYSPITCQHSVPRFTVYMLSHCQH